MNFSRFLPFLHLLGRNKRRSTGRIRKPRTQIDPIKSRRSFRAIAVVIGASFVFWLLFAPGGGLVPYFRAKSKQAGLQRKIALREQENAALRAEIERLKTDEAYLERVARGKYQLLRKDERVYDFNKPAKK